MVDEPRRARAIIPTSAFVGIRDLELHQGCNLAVDACRRLLDAGSEPDIVGAVESLLGGTLHSPMSMVEAAERLCVTERTLRRQLDRAGQRFSDVRDRVRERRATFLLRQSGFSITAIAAEVGFSDPREFRRAYRRWTGHAPSAARKARASS